MPGIQPQISNLTDDFSYQVSSVANFSGAAPYTWQNTGISANINQSTAVTAGSMTLVITDANATQVCSRSLADNGTFVTADGVAGAWTIRVTYSGASGTVNFRAQKKTLPTHRGPALHRGTPRTAGVDGPCGPRRLTRTRGK